MDRATCKVPLPDFETELRDIIKNAGSAPRGAVGLAEDLLRNVVQKLRPATGAWSYDGKRLHLGAHSHAVPKKFGAAVVALVLRYREWFAEVQRIHPTMVGVVRVSEGSGTRDPTFSKRSTTGRLTADEAADALEEQEQRAAGFAVLVPGRCALVMHGEVAGEFHRGCDKDAVWPPEYPEFCCIEHAGLHAMTLTIAPPDPDEEQLEAAREEGKQAFLQEVAEALDVVTEWKGGRLSPDKVEEAVMERLREVNGVREYADTIEAERDALIDQVRTLSGDLTLPEEQCVFWLENHARKHELSQRS